MPGAVIGAAVLFVLNRSVNHCIYGSSRFASIVAGKSRNLIENGTVDREALRKELISLPELRSIARRQGFLFRRSDGGYFPGDGNADDDPGGMRIGQRRGQRH